MSHDHGSAGHGTTKQYVVGFILSIILTIIPFYMVMSGDFSKSVNILVISVTALAQVLIQLIFFLHMNGSEEKKWDVISFLYTILTVIILLVGSVWIMNYLHFNMMID